MSKKADIIRIYNDEKRTCEYFVKGFNVTESIKILLKEHKKAYDEEVRVFDKWKAYHNAKNEVEQQIADLEAKLAESEEKYKKAYREGLLQKQFDKDMEIVELKQQLADKNADLHQIYSHLGVEAFGEDIHEQALKEIRRLLEEIAKKDKQLRTKIGNMKSTDFIKMCISCGFLVDAKVVDNQDKISFCIEKLDKLKELMCKECECVGECYDNDYFILYQHQVKKIFDTQIEQLKKGLK